MFFKFLNFTYLWLCCVFTAVSQLSPVVAHRLLIAVASLVEHKPWGSGFSRCCVQAQMLWVCTSAPTHTGCKRLPAGNVSF